MRTQLLLVKLALRACERGDTEGASEVLRAVLALGQASCAAPPVPPRAVPVTEFAQQCGYTPKHVHHLIARGEIPADATIGRGRGLRILVARALEALRATSEPPVRDEIEHEGAEYVRRRDRLRVVKNNGGNR